MFLQVKICMDKNWESIRNDAFELEPSSQALL